MALSKEQVKNVEDVLKASLRNKFQNYKPEPASMPFHTRLLGIGLLFFGKSVLQDSPFKEYYYD